MTMDHAINGKIAPCIEWEITRKCNLDCLHCCMSGRTARPDELSRAEALRAAGRMAELGCRSVTLSGGEPLLRPDWPDLAAALAGAGLSVQLVTNGQALGRREARTAVDSGVRLVFLSLDGMQPSHDRMRRHRGAFARVLRAADALAREGVPLGFITTLVRGNVADLEPLAGLVRELGAVVWQVWLGIARDRSDLWLEPRHAAGIASMIGSLQGHCPALVPGDNLAGPGGPCSSGCEQGRRVLGIQSNGEVRGCLALPERFNRGSIRDCDLSILWQDANELRGLALKDMRGPCQSSCHATALAWAGRPGAQPADRHRAGTRALRRAGALAASLVLASGISIGCRSGSGRVAANQPVEKNAALDAAQAADTTKDPVEDEGIHAAAEDRLEAQEAALADQAALWGLPFNASCLCESEEKNDQGEPRDTQPCMCISHMMCPPSSMWICPSGYTRKITSGEGDDGDE
jgi:MoaA/NifB/PqqE/SkfB family radical SAM enzyme